MRIEISFSSIYFSSSLYDYFLREQSQHTLENLIYSAKGNMQSVLNAIDRYAEDNGYDVDEIDEIFYGYSVEEIARKIGIELKEEEEEEEEE